MAIASGYGRERYSFSRFGGDSSFPGIYLRVMASMLQLSSTDV
jgi:hypothetical protein